MGQGMGKKITANNTEPLIPLQKLRLLPVIRGNEKDKVKVRQKHIWEKYAFCPSL